MDCLEGNPFTCKPASSPWMHCLAFTVKCRMSRQSTVDTREGASVKTERTALKNYFHQNPILRVPTFLLLQNRIVLKHHNAASLAA